MRHKEKPTKTKGEIISSLEATTNAIGAAELATTLSGMPLPKAAGLIGLTAEVMTEIAKNPSENKREKVICGAASAAAAEIVGSAITTGVIATTAALTGPLAPVSAVTVGASVATALQPLKDELKKSTNAACQKLFEDKPNLQQQKMSKNSMCQVTKIYKQQEAIGQSVNATYTDYIQKKLDALVYQQVSSNAQLTEINPQYAMQSLIEKLDDATVNISSRYQYADILISSFVNNLASFSLGFKNSTIAEKELFNPIQLNMGRSIESAKKLHAELQKETISLNTFKTSFVSEVKQAYAGIDAKTSQILATTNKPVAFSDTLLEDQLKPVIDCYENPSHMDAEKVVSLFNHSKAAVKGLSAMTMLFAEDPILANQIDVVGHGTISCIESCLALTNPLMVPYLTPFGAITTIVGVIANVVGVFKSRSTSNTAAFILNAIRNLSQQVEHLRQEMHGRFDEVLAQMDKQQQQVIDNFCHLYEAQSMNIALIHLLALNMEKRFDRLESQVSMIPRLIAQMRDGLGYEKYTALMERLVELHGMVVDDVVQGDHYIERAALINAIGLNHSINVQPVDVMQLNTMPMLPSSYLHLPNYFAKALIKEKNISLDPNLGDPFVVCVSALLSIMHNLKQFPDPNHSEKHLRINESSMNHMMDYFCMLNQISALMVASQSNAILDKLISTFEEKYMTLRSHIHSKLEDIIKERRNAHLSEVSVVLQENRSALDFGFTNTTIDIATYDWFHGKIKRWARYHQGNKWTCINEAYVAEYTDHQAQQAYQKRLSGQIRIQKAAAQQAASEVVSKRYDRRGSMFDWVRFAPSLEASNYHGARYIKPNQAGNPFLPICDPILPGRSDFNFLRSAQYLAVGDIQFSYDIEENKFLLHIEMNCLDASRQKADLLRVLTLTFDYDPSFFQGNEAIWYYWLGGELPQSANGVLERRVMSQSRYRAQWTKACEAKYGIGNFGGQEICNYIWSGPIHGGAFDHNGGEFDFTHVDYTLPGEFKVVKGKVEVLKQLNIKDCDEAICHISYNHQSLQIIETLFDKQLQRIKEESISSLQRHIDTKIDNDAFSNACVEYEHAYRNLYGALSFAFYDTLNDAKSDLALWFDTHLVNIEKIKIHLSSLDHTKVVNEDGVTFQPMKSFCGPSLLETDKLKSAILTAQKNCVMDDEFQLTQPDCKFLAEVVQQICDFIVLYAPNCVSGDAVASLSDTATMAFESVSTLLSHFLKHCQDPSTINKVLEGTFGELGPTLASFSEANRSLFLSKLRSKLQEKNLAIEWRGDKLKMITMSPSQSGLFAQQPVVKELETADVEAETTEVDPDWVHIDEADIP